MNGIRTLSDEEILNGIRSNDINKALYHLYQQMADAVVAYVVHNGGSQQDGDDVFQETVMAFIDLVQKGKFRGESGIKTFLVAIGRNIWHNQWRKTQSLDNRGRVYEMNRDTEEDLSGLLDEKEVRRQLLELIDRLGESCKTILTLFYYENLSFREIAEKMAYENEQVARNRKYRCMKELTDLIKGSPLILDNQ
jgi:RNA polymerase sigma factor (sigma-70 family)